jgi:hypothetical protein
MMKMGKSTTDPLPVKWQLFEVNPADAIPGKVEENADKNAEKDKKGTSMLEGKKHSDSQKDRAAEDRDDEDESEEGSKEVANFIQLRQHGVTVKVDLNSELQTSTTEESDSEGLILESHTEDVGDVTVEEDGTVTGSSSSSSSSTSSFLETVTQRGTQRGNDETSVVVERNDPDYPEFLQKRREQRVETVRDLLHLDGKTNYSVRLITI